MHCNIDARGQRVRRIWGALNLLLALTLAASAFLASIWWLYLLAALFLLSGLFAFWEAHKKWCIVRALGLKTPL